VTLWAKLVTELVGTFIFLTVIAESGSAGPLAPLAIGAALIAMVYMGGHVSGAHYNPAGLLRAVSSGCHPVSTMAAYWATQLIAGILAFVCAYLVSGHTPGIHPGVGVYWGSALAAEAVITVAPGVGCSQRCGDHPDCRQLLLWIGNRLDCDGRRLHGSPISGGAFNRRLGRRDPWGGSLRTWLVVRSVALHRRSAGRGAIAAGIHRTQTLRAPVLPEQSERQVQDSA